MLSDEQFQISLFSRVTWVIYHYHVNHISTYIFYIIQNTSIHITGPLKMLCVYYYCCDFILLLNWKFLRGRICISWSPTFNRRLHISSFQRLNGRERAKTKNNKKNTACCTVGKLKKKKTTYGRQGTGGGVALELGWEVWVQLWLCHWLGGTWRSGITLLNLCLLSVLNSHKGPSGLERAMRLRKVYSREEICRENWFESEATGRERSCVNLTRRVRQPWLHSRERTMWNSNHSILAQTQNLKLRDKTWSWCSWEAWLSFNKEVAYPSKLSFSQ